MVDHSVGKDLPSVSVESFEYFPGRGLTATVNCIEVQANYLLDSVSLINICNQSLTIAMLYSQ